MKDYSKLKKLAEAATKCYGAMRVEKDYNGVYQVVGAGSWNILSAWHTPDGKSKDNAEFHAAASPDAVLELIAEVERLEGKNSNQCASIREYQDLVMGGDVSIGMLKSDLRVTTDERDQLKTEVERLNDEYDKAWRHDLNDKNNLQVLAAEVVSMSKDAARYRWLRQYDFDIGSYHPEGDFSHESWFERFDDQSIDRMIAEEIAFEEEAIIEANNK